MDNWKDLAEMAAFGLAGIFFAVSLLVTSFLYKVIGLVLAKSISGLTLCLVRVRDIYSKINRK